MLGALWLPLAVVVGHNPDAPPDVVSDLNCNIDRPCRVTDTFEVTTRPLNVVKPVARDVFKNDPTRSLALNDVEGVGPQVELGAGSSSSGRGMRLAGVACCNNRFTSPSSGTFGQRSWSTR